MTKYRKEVVILVNDWPGVLVLNDRLDLKCLMPIAKPKSRALFYRQNMRKVKEKDVQFGDNFVRLKFAFVHLYEPSTIALRLFNYTIANIFGSYDCKSFIRLGTKTSKLLGPIEKCEHFY